MGAFLCAMGVTSSCAGAAKNAAKDALESAKGKAGSAARRLLGRAKYTEERVPENYMAEYYMEEYTGSGGTQPHPEDLTMPRPLPASKTSQPGPTASIAKTAAPLGKKSKYMDFPNDDLGFGEYPDVYDSPGIQEGGLTRKRSKYLNNQRPVYSGNLGDATPLSPMVEREINAPVNTGLIVLLTLLFITFVILKK